MNTPRESGDHRPAAKHSFRPDNNDQPITSSFGEKLASFRRAGENVLAEVFDPNAEQREYRNLRWHGKLAEYIGMHLEKRLLRNSHQFLLDAVMACGVEYDSTNREVKRYKIFDDPFSKGKDAVFGLEKPLKTVVKTIDMAAKGLGAEKRIIMLAGPVGTAKSTIVRLLKRAVEEYSKTPEGAIFTVGLRTKDPKGNEYTEWSKINEEPLNFLPEKIRNKLLDKINQAAIARGEEPIKFRFGERTPALSHVYHELMREYDNDVTKVMDHIEIRRVVFSEKDRIGIGTFQPKDEKNQDSTELTGDINYRKIGQYGSDSHPLVHDLDGEFCVANRGILEFVEILKLDVAFLYDLLTATQEQKIKPKKSAQVDIDEVLIGSTNEPELRRLKNNELMEAFRDRTIRIDIPYNLKLSTEVQIYKKDYGALQKEGRIAPHTLECAAMFAILTRLEPPTQHGLTELQKLKLYNGTSIPGYTEEKVKEMQEEAKREGHEGISPRFIQNTLGSLLVHRGEKAINPFMLFNALEEGLLSDTLISDELKPKYKQLIGQVKEEYEEIIKREVQIAISADPEALSSLCSNYIENIKAYCQGETMKNKHTGRNESPDEKLMRSIEEKINIPANRKDDFRREIMNYIGALAVEGKSFDYTKNERLCRALEGKLFEDAKHQINFRSYVSDIASKKEQEKIEVIKTRLMRDFHYDENTAVDILQYVASIFARGEPRQ